MTSGAYGARLGEYVGVEAPPTMRSELLRTAEFAVTRLCWDRPDEPTFTRIEAEDAFLVFLQRRDIPANPYWVSGRAVEMDPLKRGQFLLLDLRREHSSIVQAAVDCLAFYVPRAVFGRMADEMGGRRVDTLRVTPGCAIQDPIVWHLGETVLQTLDDPGRANPLMIDHVGMALVAHLAETYGSGGPVAAVVRGGLSPAQLRKAKDRLMADLSARVGLDELARACGLSRSYFAHAFKATTGVAPHQWLTRRRIERAKELLLKSSKSVEEVALECGFVDQSHFTRAFSRIAGMTPGRWRRTWRS